MSLWVPVLICGFWMQNRNFWARITSLYGSQPSSVDFACNTATFGPELQVSVGPRHHLSFCACNTVWFPPEWLVNMSSSPHLWFLHAIQRLLDQNYKSLWVPDLTCRFVHAIQRDFYRYDKSIGFQPSSVVLWLQNCDFRTRHTSLYGTQTSSVVLSTHNSVLSTRIKRLL